MPPDDGLVDTAPDEHGADLLRLSDWIRVQHGCELAAMARDARAAGESLMGHLLASR